MRDLEATRLSLHAVAELLLAGPQYDASGTIKLRVTPGGFGTVAAPSTRVDGTALIAGDRLVALDGRTVSAVAAEAGLPTRSLADLYSDGPGLTADHRLTIDPDAAAEIADGFRVGAEALAAFAPDTEAVLWPEHFDLGISLDEVNYGVSPGDSFLDVPYAYVGPWSPGDVTGPFWNAPFGAAHPLSEIPDLGTFFADGRDLTDR